MAGAPRVDDLGYASGAAYVQGLRSHVFLTVTGGVRHWSDGTVAKSCYVYRYPPFGFLYAGAFGDGAYRIDPDGEGGKDPYPAWCDMTTNGGGWTLVANQAASGNWMPFDPSLNPAVSHGTYPATGTWDHDTHYYRAFVDLDYDELMLRTGDGDTWCVLPYRDVVQPSTDLFARTVPVLASQGTASATGARTNVLFRYGLRTDPWIGCEGHHLANASRMLWGESGYFAHTAFKNANGGIGLFVRPNP